MLFFCAALTHGQRRAASRIDARRSIFKCYGHNWGDALRINSHSHIHIRQALMVQVAHSKKRPTAPCHLIIQQHILRSLICSSQMFILLEMFCLRRYCGDFWYDQFFPLSHITLSRPVKYEIGDIFKFQINIG